MKRSRVAKSRLIRLLCLVVCGALLSPGVPISYRWVLASAARHTAPPSDEEKDGNELPDLDRERELGPQSTQADPPIPSRLAGWSPYSFNLNAPTNPLSVSITTPSSGSSFAEGTPVAIAANASSSTAISSVSFLANGTLIGTIKAAPYTVTWNNPTAGSYALTAVAQNTAGATATSTPVNITITGIGPPTVTISSPTSGAQFSPPANITVAANAQAGSGRTISRVEFYAGTTLIRTITASPYTFVWANVGAGMYSLTAKAFDNTGASTTTSPATSVTVSSGSGLPAVNLTSPPPGTVFTTPVNISLSANATASSGRNIARVDFYYADTTLIGSATSAPYTTTWNNAPPGAYSLTAKATDNLGVSNTSVGVTITVNAGLAPTVSIISPSNGTSYQAPATITINANAAASSGRTIMQVAFYANANPNPINTDTTAPYSFSWSNVAAGTYRLVARATDNTGAFSDSTAVTVFVAAPTPPPAGDGFFDCPS